MNNRNESLDPGRENLLVGHQAAGRRIRLDGARKQAVETGRNRLLVVGTIFSLAFLVIGLRLIDLALIGPGAEPLLAASSSAKPATSGRADIVDRNGIVLATSLPTMSLYADPAAVLDAEEAAAKLTSVLSRLDRKWIVAKLTSPGRFVWLARNLTPEQTFQVNRLGIPGLAFQRGERRVYPQGREAAHVIGMTDVDGRGIAGVEKQFDQALRVNGKPVQLSIDLRVQAMLRRELSWAVKEYSALGAAGAILDVTTGEITALVSLPDFDPNSPATAVGGAGFNRASKGVYEMGSTFKLFTMAAALDSGTVDLAGGYDATNPIRVARFTINDYHGKGRWLSVPEILVYSSNIGAAKMAMDMGAKVQREYLGKFNLLSPLSLELPEVGQPLIPRRWRDVNTMTVAFGHGIAVSPLQLAAGVSTVVNGGIARPVTLLKHRPADDATAGTRVLSAETSRQMRGLMRMVVSRGTGKNADVPGYRVGGKTGTAEKLVGGRYRSRSLISSFVGAFPMDAPRYVLLAVLDEPKGTAKTNNYATGGWVAAPVVGRMVRQMGPLLGMAPARPTQDVTPIPDQPLVVAIKAALADVRGQGLAAR